MSATPANAPGAAQEEIDAVLAVTPGSRLDLFRRRREEVRTRSQTCWGALFEPEKFDALSAGERFAAAWRAAELAGAAALASRYLGLFEKVGGFAEMGRPRFVAILAHAEKVGREPRSANREDLAALAKAGLSPAAVVTLSQIIGFVAYQARVVASLALLVDGA